MAWYIYQAIAGLMNPSRPYLGPVRTFFDYKPIMTIHKSKGLEYHTVVFVGFEDSAFWGYRKNPTEETCAFFVAFSRAKQRVVFTYCDRREKPVGTPAEAQERTTIGPLYELLQQARVSLEIVAD